LNRGEIVMRILLDLDGTVLTGGQLHPRFYEFQALVRRNGHAVIVWSSHCDGRAIASLMGFNYLHKDSSNHPIADVLIDDSCVVFSKLCVVKVAYNFLDDFLKEEGKEKGDYQLDTFTTALAEIASLGANPTTKYGCKSRADFIRHVDKMWQIAYDALKGE